MHSDYVTISDSFYPVAILEMLTDGNFIGAKFFLNDSTAFFPSLPLSIPLSHWRSLCNSCDEI